MDGSSNDEINASALWFLDALMRSDASEYLGEHKQAVGRLIPEMIPCFGFEQNNKYHVYDVYEHTLKALAHTPEDLIIRTAVFFHDIGKPVCYTEDEQGCGHFFGHGRAGAKITAKILKRLQYPSQDRRDIEQLIFFHDATFLPGKRHVRRWLNRIGEAQFRRLLEVKRADIIGHNPIYTDEGLRNMDKLSLALEVVLQEEKCLKIMDLALTGNDLIQLGCPEGNMVGEVLRYLLDQVAAGVIPNEPEILAKEVQQYLKMQAHK